MLTIATANAASGRDRRGLLSEASWTAWADAAAGLEVDVLAVQEVDRLLPRSGDVDQTGVLAQVLAGDGRAWSARFAAAVHGTPGSAVTFRAARGGDPAQPSYGVALLTRHPVLRWAELRLTASRARLPVRLPEGAPQRMLWVPDEPRVALAAVVDAPVGPLTVVTTHLSFAPWRATAQLREVVRWSRTLPGPRVLLGDLNLPRRVAVAASGWTATAAVATYPAAGPRLQLDHVLGDGVRPGAPTTYRLADSDHLALRVGVDLAS
ncbi:MAG: endonuclease [Nocardioides sp.]|nr:endonuclease [Nocardioides sp.]